MFLFVVKNVLFDPIQISLFSFIRILIQVKGIADSREKLFLGFRFISTDITNFRDILRDNIL